MLHHVTPRQLIALLAVYHGELPYNEPGGVYGEAHEKAGQLYWNRRTSMGGAIMRMVESLRTNGFVSDPDNYERREKKPYADAYNQLTVKGYEAIQERYGKLPIVNQRWQGQLPVYDFNEKLSLKELCERMAERSGREVEMDRLRKEQRERERKARAENLARESELRVQKLRKLFGDHSLADNWTDQQLIDFADAVAVL